MKIDEQLEGRSTKMEAQDNNKVLNAYDSGGDAYTIRLNNNQVVFEDGCISGTVANADKFIAGYSKNGDVPLDFADLRSKGTTFSSNAMRSEKKLPFWRFPLRAMIEWAKRFRKGEKYDTAGNITHNWKLAINSDDVEFVRQFFDHALEHMFKAKEMASQGVVAVDYEGEGMFDHLGAAMWNIASLIEYLDKNPELVCRALDQTPKAIK